MKPAISDRPSAVNTNQRSRRSVLWLGVVFAALGVGFLAFPKSALAEVAPVVQAVAVLDHRCLDLDAQPRSHGRPLVMILHLGVSRCHFQQ